MDTGFTTTIVSQLNLTGGVTGPTGPTGGNPGYRGVFSDSTTQTLSTGLTGAPITFNTDELVGYGVARGSPTSHIVLSNAGTYNIQFSLQLLHDGGGGGGGGSTSTVYIWLRKSGLDVPRTNTKIVLANNEEAVAAWNFVESFTASQYFELIAASTRSNTQILAESPAAFGPDIPSVILTVIQVA